MGPPPDLRKGGPCPRGPAPCIIRGMKTLVLLLALVAACATPGPPKKFGDIRLAGNQGAWVCGYQVGLTAGTACPAVAGNNATVVVFSTTSQGDNSRGQYPGLQRVLVHLRFNQATTVLYQTLVAGSTTWRTMNGGGAGDALAANTDYAVDFLVLGPDVRVAVSTGGSGPTTREEAVEVFNDRAVGQ